MTPKKSDWKMYLTGFLIMYLMIFFVVLHYTVLYDRAIGIRQKGDPITFSIEEAVGTELTEENGYGIFTDASGPNPLEITLNSIDHIFSDPFDLSGLVISHLIKPMLWSAFFFVCVVGMYFSHRALYHQDAPGKEKGSSQWFKDFGKYRKEFEDTWTKWDQQQGLPDNNALLAQGLKLSMNARKTQRNLNMMVVGGSGTGKTFRFIKPNLAQINCSYVITDPSGEIMQVMGIMLQEHGYNLKLFSTSDMRHSNHYNPMDYIYDEDGEINQTKVGVLVSTFIKNAGEVQKGSKGGDPFWTKSSTAWMTFAVLFVARFFPLESRNMNTILKLAQMGKTDENSSSSDTQLDLLVAQYRRQDDTAKCFSSYDTFKLAPAKTANSILISIAVDLNPFSMDDVRNMTTTSYVCKRDSDGMISEYIRYKGELIRDSENLDLDTMGDAPTALFINIPQAQGAYNFLVSMLYSQLFDALYSVAEKVAPNRYHIFDGRGDIIESEFATEEAAKKRLELYQNSSIKKVKRNGLDHFYIYNAKGGKDTPPMYMAEKGLGKGYLKEVYSEEVGKKFLARCHSISRQTVKKHKLLGIIPYNKTVVEKKNAYVGKGSLRLPIHLRFLMDEFSNIGEVPNFEKMLSTMRKYEISCTIILQSLAQIKAQYKDIWEVLVGNCDTIIFLGSSENDTVKYMSEKLGKATINTIDNSQSKSSTSGSISESFKKEGRDLLDPAEMAKMDNAYSIVVVRGMDPFFVKKLSFADHPHFKETGDYRNDKKIGTEYLDQHFKCLPQNVPTCEQAKEEEQENKEVLRETKKQKKRADKKEPVTSTKGKKAVAEAMDVKEDGVSIAMKTTESIPSAEYVEVDIPNVTKKNTKTEPMPIPDPVESGNESENISPDILMEVPSTPVAPLSDGGDAGPESAGEDWFVFSE